jgi:hypothetical protein
MIDRIGAERERERERERGIVSELARCVALINGNFVDERKPAMHGLVEGDLALSPARHRRNPRFTVVAFSQMCQIQTD